MVVYEVSAIGVLGRGGGHVGWIGVFGVEG